MSDIDPMITIAARMDEMRAKLAEHELLFGVALHTDDFLQRLLAGLAHQLPPETPRTVEGIVDAVANMALKLDAHEDASTPAFDEIAKLCGVPGWEYPGQVVRDVEKVVKERDEALGEISRMTLRPAAEIIEAERKRMARLDEMQAERDFWRSQTNALTPAYIKLQDQLRIAKAQGRCPWVFPDEDRDEGNWHCQLEAGHEDHHEAHGGMGRGHGLTRLWYLPPQVTKRDDGSYTAGPPPDGRSVNAHLDELIAAFNPIACSQGTLGCRGRGEMHACVSE